MSKRQRRLGSSKTYGYNALNLINAQTNGRGQATSYQYDDAGRLSSLTDPTGTVSYTYDNQGNVLTVTDSTGVITRVYDQLNRATKYTDSKGNIIQYAYDEVGNLTTLTYPRGKTVQYGYNAVNQLISVTDWANRATQYEYDANGQLTKTTRPDGSIQTMLYNADGWLTQQKDIDKNGIRINQYDYTYDQVGKIIGEQSSRRQEPYTANQATMTYTMSNQLATYKGQAVQYDADGNMTSGPLRGYTANFAYDARNRLISVRDTSYGYDAENNRIAVITNGQQTGYVINPQAKLSQLLIKTDVQGKNTYYIYGLGLIGQEEADGTYKTYHFDNRGSTTAITDLQGNVTDTFGYGPFGELNQIPRTGTTDTPFQYNGRDGVMTDSNGLYYMRARYYDPDIKRFINQDVMEGNIKNGQSMNRYAYVNGNPVSQVDPFGLSAVSQETGEAEIQSYTPNETAFDSYVNALNRETAKMFGQIYDGGYYVTEQQAEGNRTAAIIAFGEAVGANAVGAVKVIRNGLSDLGEGIGSFWNKLWGAGNATRVFTSSDPLVGDLANLIESKLPGRISDVNRVVKDSSGRILTDFDIELDNVVIQVKSGGGKGLTSQLERTANATDKTVIGYGPDIKPSIINGTNNKGFNVFTNVDDLIEYLSNELR